MTSGRRSADLGRHQRVVVQQRVQGRLGPLAPPGQGAGGRSRRFAAARSTAESVPRAASCAEDLAPAPDRPHPPARARTGPCATATAGSRRGRRSRPRTGLRPACRDSAAPRRRCRGCGGRTARCAGSGAARLRGRSARWRARRSPPRAPCAGSRAHPGCCSRATCMASVEAPETRSALARFCRSGARMASGSTPGCDPEAAVLDRQRRRHDALRELPDLPEPEPLVRGGFDRGDRRGRELADELSGAVAHQQRRLGSGERRAPESDRDERRPGEDCRRQQQEKASMERKMRQSQVRILTRRPVCTSRSGRAAHHRPVDRRQGGDDNEEEGVGRSHARHQQQAEGDAEQREDGPAREREVGFARS